MFASETIPQGLKPVIFSAVSARLKPCPYRLRVGKNFRRSGEHHPSGAKARILFACFGTAEAVPFPILQDQECCEFAIGAKALSLCGAYWHGSRALPDPA
jgi:hypothetical protein